MQNGTSSTSSAGPLITWIDGDSSNGHQGSSSLNGHVSKHAMSDDKY
eukprot:CAMPEP_0181063100 /NCGR_PEP_ID=MMETSP1070-20121207/23454_1 /TAXON_ID=265543 /ORGANISM="Minutocellus polymorphus, Strain NH13" /LENGTH=46 /DNA_ID= /DNA_START= /DNA_END= /DNA_ORIENTATION=